MANILHRLSIDAPPERVHQLAATGAKAGLSAPGDRVAAAFAGSCSVGRESGYALADSSDRCGRRADVPCRLRMERAVWRSKRPRFGGAVTGSPCGERVDRWRPGDLWSRVTVRLPRHLTVRPIS
jgi:hypothetical protein